MSNSRMLVELAKCKLEIIEKQEACKEKEDELMKKNYNRQLCKDMKIKTDEDLKRDEEWEQSAAYKIFYYNS